jgi:hypothetical protein
MLISIAPAWVLASWRKYKHNKVTLGDAAGNFLQ